MRCSRPEDAGSSLLPGAGRAEPGDSGCRCGEAVRLKLHYSDGLQLLNLPWPSAGSNVGHWGVQDEKHKGEGWATKIYLTNRAGAPSQTAWTGFYYHWLGSWDWIWCSTQKDVSGATQDAKPTWWLWRGTNRMIERERGRKQQSEDGRGRAQSYTVIIDFPSALQWRFLANIFVHNVRRKGSIRGWYERHENGKALWGVGGSSWSWQIETWDDTNWAQIWQPFTKTRHGAFN